MKNHMSKLDIAFIIILIVLEVPAATYLIVEWFRAWKRRGE